MSDAPSLMPSTTFNSSYALVLHVGPDRETMLVHGSRLASSDFFKAAMKKEWERLEGKTRVIKLPEDSPIFITHYLHHIYGDILPTRIYHNKNPGGPKAEAYILLAELYVLGERLLDTNFRNAIFKEFIRLMALREINSGNRWNPTTPPVNIIYGGTTAGDPARRLMVDVSLRLGSDNWHTSDVDPAFLFDFMQAYYRAVKSGPPTIEELKNLDLVAGDYLV